MTAPPVGRYWTQRAPAELEDKSHMRRGATREFDNAHRSIERTWARLHKLIRPGFEVAAEDSGRGDPPLAVIDGRQMSVGSIEYAAMASRFLPFVTPADNGWGLEIGGGYGGLADACLRMGQRAWTIVDIPQVLPFSRYYLEPWGPLVVFREPQDLEADPTSYSLIVQTRGFMEMDPAELAHYFGLIQRGRLLRPGGLFFTINRARKVTRFVDYPWDDRWRVLEAGLWPEGRGMPMLLLMRATEPSPDLAKALEAYRGL